MYGCTSLEGDVHRRMIELCMLHPRRGDGPIVAIVLGNTMTAVALPPGWRWTR